MKNKNQEEKLKKEIEDKWFKECERLGNEIDKLKKEVKRITKTKSPKNHPEFLELKKQLKLTNIAYNDVCYERDNLKKQTKEIPNITEFKRGFQEGYQKAKEDFNKKIDEFKNICKFDKNFNNFIKNILKENKEEIEKLPKKVDWINPLMNFSRLVLEKYNKKFEEIISKEDNHSQTSQGGSSERKKSDKSNSKKKIVFPYSSPDTHNPQTGQADKAKSITQTSKPNVETAPEDVCGNCGKEPIYYNNKYLLCKTCLKKYYPKSFAFYNKKFKPKKQTGCGKKIQFRNKKYKCGDKIFFNYKDKILLCPECQAKEKGEKK